MPSDHIEIIYKSRQDLLTAEIVTYVQFICQIAIEAATKCDREPRLWTNCGLPNHRVKSDGGPSKKLIYVLGYPLEVIIY